MLISCVLLISCGGGGSTDASMEVVQLTQQINDLRAKRNSLESKIELERAEKGERKEILRSVKIVKMFPIPLTDVLVLPGSVEPFEEVDVSTQISGLIEKVNIEEGQAVTANQPIFELESNHLKVAMEQAQVALNHSEKQYTRQRNLKAGQVGSEEELDMTELQFKNAQANFALTQINLNWSKITSPIDGILDRRLVERGEYVNPGDVLARIVDLKQVKVLVNIPEKDILYFTPGDRVKVINEHPNTKSPSTEGTLSFLAVSSDPVTRTFPAKIVVDNQNGDFRPGMIVRAELTRRKNLQAMAVPFFTIVDREDGKGVFIERDGVAHEMKVEIGIIRKGLVEITSGLNAGDNLIVVGQRELVDQEKVEVADDLTPLAQSMLTSGQDLSDLAMKIF